MTIERYFSTLYDDEVLLQKQILFCRCFGNGVVGLRVFERK